MNQATGGSVVHADIRLLRQPLLPIPSDDSATPKCRVQLRINKLLDEPTNPIPDGSLDRIEPTSAKQFRRPRRTVVAMLLHGVISLGVSPPSLARCTSRRLHHREFPPLLRRHARRRDQDVHVRIVARAKVKPVTSRLVISPVPPICCGPGVHRAVAFVGSPYANCGHGGHPERRNSELAGSRRPAYRRRASKRDPLAPKGAKF
jgi:hypothetical protein